MLIRRSVLRFHLSMVFPLTGVAALFVSTGDAERGHGYALGDVDVGSLVGSFLVFGGVRIPEPT